MIGIVLRLSLHASLISGLAVLALATVPSKQPGLAPKRLMSLALFQAVPDVEPQREVDLTKFRDIKPHQTIPGSPVDAANSIVLPVLVGIVSLGCVALVLWYRYRRPPDPNRLAMAEIDRLESQYSSDPTQAYDQLSMLVRQSISANSGVNALSQTTDQVIDSLQSSNAPLPLVSQVGKLLGLADESKFTGRIDGTTASNEDVFNLTRSIVRAQASLSVGQAKGDG